jgi:hypothetical protein
LDRQTSIHNSGFDFSVQCSQICGKRRSDRMVPELLPTQSETFLDLIPPSELGSLTSLRRQRA